MPHADFFWIIKNFYVPVYLIYIPVFFIKALLLYSSLKTILIKGFFIPSFAGIFFLIILLVSASLFEKNATLWKSNVSYGGGVKLLLFSFYPFVFSFIFLFIPFIGFFLSAFLFFYGVYLMVTSSQIFFPMDRKTVIYWYLSILIVFFFIFILLIALFLSYEILSR